MILIYILYNIYYIYYIYLFFISYFLNIYIYIYVDVDVDIEIDRYLTSWASFCSNFLSALAVPCVCHQSLRYK